MEDKIRALNIIKGKPIETRPIGRPRRRLQDNIRMDLEQICVSARNWIDLAQDRDYWKALVNARFHKP